ncbi:MAG TPA: MBL fold metallo-hydrolase [bacterium]|nr:MBL fold metallo-hydrolase [bacterium]
MSKNNPSDSVTMTIVYDNYQHRQGLKTGWGFSCVVRGLDRTILFDTGGDGKTLLGNLGDLRIDPADIDVVFLSHIDGDHTGGLSAFLAANANVTVYLPASFPGEFRSRIEQAGAEVVEMRQPQMLFDNVFTTGELGRLKVEQSLVAMVHDIGVVISGCAHPGIERMVAKARDTTGGTRFLAIGGFHFFMSGDESIREVIERLKSLGVEWAAPTHCSGDRARELFEEAFGDRYIRAGVGKTIDLSALG